MTPPAARSALHPEEKISPKGVAVRYLDDGSMDEVVASGCDVHLEYMSDRIVWLRIGDVVVNLYAQKNKLMSNVEIDP